MVARTLKLTRRAWWWW